MFSCLIVIAVMRWVAKPLVWLSILGVLVMLGFGKLNQPHQNSNYISWQQLKYCYLIVAFTGTYYSFKQYTYLNNRPPTDTNVNTNLSLWLDTLVQNPKFWLYTGIAAAVVLVIILLIILVLRKRIVIAIALVKEGSKYVNDINFILFP